MKTLHVSRGRRQRDLFLTLMVLLLPIGAARLPAQAAGPCAPAAPAATPAPAPTPSPSPSALTGPLGPSDPRGLGTWNVVRQDPGQVTSETSFNPALSVILDGLYYTEDRAGTVGELAERADGFAPADENEGGHDHGGPLERGFSLREAEITFSGSVDPYFDLWTILAVGDGGIAIEEGYVQTRRFLPGLQLKAGRFFSGFGYLNRQHPHQWDFVDRALPYEALLDGSLDETGLQLTWLPELPFYAQLGVEALQGENRGFSAQRGGEASEFFDEKAGPRLFTGFLKVSPNAGYRHAVQFGTSYAYSRRHQETGMGPDARTAAVLQGHGEVLGFDLVWKYDSSAAYGRRDVTVQAEYLRRVRDLELIAEGGTPRHPPTAAVQTQDGLYAQAVYGVASRWTVALRWESLGLTNQTRTGSQTRTRPASTRYSANLTFNPTEFSRLRAQFDHGSFHVEGTRQAYNQFFVQFQMSLGAHGAHRF
jgi:hypothetical protein